MSIPLPPIYRDCRRLLVHTEDVVRRFSRYHKYTVGADLRQQAMALMRGVHRAVYDRAHQVSHVQALVWQVDDYKLTLQLAMEVGAFVHAKAGQPKRSAPGTAAAALGAGFTAFETAATLAAAIGKQCGGWQKKASSQTTSAQADAKSASSPRAQVGTGAQAPEAAGPKPGASPPARPASLSVRTASTGDVFTKFEATP